MSKWSKEQIKKEIEEMDGYLPVSEIEKRLGMPPTTLQKVLKGTRVLPKKYEKVLEAYFVRKPEVEIKAEEKKEEPQIPSFRSKLEQQIFEEQQRILNSKNGK